MCYQVIEYQDDPDFRSEYYKFMQQIFASIRFDEWHKAGFWTKNYKPYSIFEEGRIISNVSAAFMKIIANDSEYKAIQIGAVATLPELRNKGLSKQLLNYVLEKHEKDVDFYFLYANESVLDFYTRFGFQHVEEYTFIDEHFERTYPYSARQLIIDNENDYKLITDLVTGRLPVTRIFGAKDYGETTMWHILNLYKNNLYYLDDKDILLIKNEDNNILHLYDVIFRNYVDSNNIVSAITSSETIDVVKYYFPPDQINYSYNKVVRDDTMLFIKGDIKLGAKAFRFPATAIT